VSNKRRATTILLRRILTAFVHTLSFALACRRVCSSRLRTSARVRREHVERFDLNQDWKKSKLATLFKKWEAVQSSFTLEVSHERACEGGKMEDVVESFLITSLLAPPGVREMAAGDAFRKLGVSALLRMAAHVHRSVGGLSVKFESLPGTLFTGLDTGVKTGLPVLINAPFFLHELNQGVLLDPRDDADVRELFPKIRQLEARRSSGMSAVVGGSPMSSRSISLWDWNREVLTASVGLLVPAILCELKHPLEYLYSRDAKMLYRYWPRFEAVRAKFKMFITPSLYVSLSKCELYLTKHDGFKSIVEGVFESKDYAVDKKALGFFRSK